VARALDHSLLHQDRRSPASMRTSIPQSASRSWLYLGAILLAATSARLSLGYVYFGFHTGDDVEILQAGFLRALGWPYQAWEIRNLLVSDLFVAPGIAAASALGVDSTRALVWVATLPFVFLASINVWLVYRLSLRWLESDGVALLASALYAFHWLPLGYGSTAYPRTASTTCVLLAALVLWERESPSCRPFLAGGLIAVAWAIRYSEAIFAFPLMAGLWMRERTWRSRVLGCSSFLAGFGALSLFTVGLEDWLTWGKPFGSLVAFARYALVERQASSLVPRQPWYWYLWRLPKWMSLALLPLLWRARRLPGALAVSLYVLLPLLVLSAIHHKQLRYLQGQIPFLMILAAAGGWSLWRGGRRLLVGALVASSLALGLGGLSFLPKKSMAAVVAAEHVAVLPDLRSVCLSQAWAYGGTLYLRGAVEVRNLPYPLSAASLGKALWECPWVALYLEDFQRDPRIPALLGKYHYERRGEYQWGSSKPVLVFQRLPTGASR
jgi:Alg9-like mannosyltransferase family